VPATLAPRDAMADHGVLFRPGSVPMTRMPIVAALLLTACATGALAADAPKKPRELLQPPKQTIASPITDRFALRGSYQQPAVTTDLRYDASSGALGTELSGEDDLGLDDELNRGSLEMTLRLLERHRIRGEFFQLRRASEATMTGTVRFGEDTYLTTERVVTESDIRFFGLTYTYSFLRAERFEFAAGGGLHLFQVEGMAAVPARRLQENFDAAGPFPTIAVDGTYRITDRFSLNARAQYFGIGIDDVDGSLGIYHADLQFRAWRSLAIGLGYTKTSLHVDSTDDSFSGRLAVDVKGPEVFLRASF
jgi:hypothetical protein